MESSLMPSKTGKWSPTFTVRFTLLAICTLQICIATLLVWFMGYQSSIVNMRESLDDKTELKVYQASTAILNQLTRSFFALQSLQFTLHHMSTPIDFASLFSFYASTDIDHLGVFFSFPSSSSSSSSSSSPASSFSPFFKNQSVNFVGVQFNSTHSISDVSFYVNESIHSGNFSSLLFLSSIDDYFEQNFSFPFSSSFFTDHISSLSSSFSFPTPFISWTSSSSSYPSFSNGTILFSMAIDAISSSSFNLTLVAGLSFSFSFSFSSFAFSNMLQTSNDEDCFMLALDSQLRIMSHSVGSDVFENVKAGTALLNLTTNTNDANSIVLCNIRDGLVQAQQSSFIVLANYDPLSIQLLLFDSFAIWIRDEKYVLRIVQFNSSVSTSSVSLSSVSSDIVFGANLIVACFLREYNYEKDARFNVIFSTLSTLFGSLMALLLVVFITTLHNRPLFRVAHVMQELTNIGKNKHLSTLELLTHVKNLYKKLEHKVDTKEKLKIMAEEKEKQKENGKKNEQKWAHEHESESENGNRNGNGNGNESVSSKMRYFFYRCFLYEIFIVDYMLQPVLEALIASYEMVEKSIQGKREFIRYCFHEFRSPLNGIILAIGEYKEGHHKKIEMQKNRRKNLRGTKKESRRRSSSDETTSAYLAPSSFPALDVSPTHSDSHLSFQQNEEDKDEYEKDKEKEKEKEKGQTAETLEEIEMEQHEYIQIIDDQAQALLRIVNGVLSFTKIEESAMTLEISPFSIYSMIFHTIQSFTHNIKEQRVNFTYELDSVQDYVYDHYIKPFLPHESKEGEANRPAFMSHIKFDCLGDKFRLKQVLVNFLSNALKFTKGKIHLGLHISLPKAAKATQILFSNQKPQRSQRSQKPQRPVMRLPKHIIDPTLSIHLISPATQTAYPTMKSNSAIIQNAQNLQKEQKEQKETKEQKEQKETKEQNSQKEQEELNDKMIKSLPLKRAILRHDDVNHTPVFMSMQMKEQERKRGRIRISQPKEKKTEDETEHANEHKNKHPSVLPIVLPPPPSLPPSLPPSHSSLSSFQSKPSAAFVPPVLPRPFSSTIVEMESGQRNAIEHKMTDLCKDMRACFKFFIMDDGCGIDHDKQDQLFQPYMQILPGKMQKGQGTGLGLHICKQLINLMGGDIGYEDASSLLNSNSNSKSKSKSKSKRKIKRSESFGRKQKNGDKNENENENPNEENENEKENEEQKENENEKEKKKEKEHLNEEKNAREKGATFWFKVELPIQLRNTRSTSRANSITPPVYRSDALTLHTTPYSVIRNLTTAKPALPSDDNPLFSPPRMTNRSPTHAKPIETKHVAPFSFEQAHETEKIDALAADNVNNNNNNNKQELAHEEKSSQEQKTVQISSTDASNNGQLNTLVISPFVTPIVESTRLLPHAIQPIDFSSPLHLSQKITDRIAEMKHDSVSLSSDFSWSSLSVPAKENKKDAKEEKEVVEEKKEKQREQTKIVAKKERKRKRARCSWPKIMWSVGNCCSSY